VTANSMTDTLLLACLLSDWNGEPTYCRWCNAALEGRRRRWCSDECASAASSNHWFNASRFAVLRRDGHTCVLCGTAELVHAEDGVVVTRLEVHHRDERAEGAHDLCSCRHHVNGLETLCRACHLSEHAAIPKPPLASVQQLSLLGGAA
jgi:5-methylcytosine-specific restriction endonuclease McrA